MKKRHLFIQLTLAMIFVIACTVGSYATIYSGWTSKAPSGITTDSCGNVINNYMFKRTIDGEVKNNTTTVGTKIYFSFQNDGKSTNLKQYRFYYRAPNHRNFTAGTLSSAAATNKYKAYGSGYYTTAVEGRYVFYLKWKDEKGTWHKEPEHRICVVDPSKNHNSFKTYHTMIGFTSAKASGSYTSSNAKTVDKLKLSNAYVGDTVYLSAQNCGGCYFDPLDLKSYTLKVIRPDGSTVSYTKEAEDGYKLKLFSEKTIKLDQTGTYQLCLHQVHYDDDGEINHTYDHNPQKLVVTKRPANLKFGKSTVNIGYSTAKYKNTLTKSTTASVTYSSTNNAVATVDASGNVTLIAPGTATIKATAASTSMYDSGTASYTLNVTKGTPTITNQASRTIYYGGSGVSVVSAGGIPEGVNAHFSSSNEGVVTVDETGKMKAVEMGTATVTISTDETSLYLPTTKTVNVKVSLSKPKLWVDSKKGSGKNRTVTLAWSKISGRTEYQLYRYNSSKKKYVKMTFKQGGKVIKQTRTMTKVQKCKKTEKFKVRAIRKVNGKTYYGPFSTVKTVKFSK